VTRDRRWRPGALGVRRPPRLEPARVPTEFGGTRDQTTRILDNLSTANRYFGGTRSVLMSLSRTVAAVRGAPLRILDVGCGRADAVREIVAWGRRQGLKTSVVGIDKDGLVVDQARMACRGWPEITIVQADARQLPFSARRFDVVVSSMLLHYFASSDAAVLLAAWGDLATQAVIISDIERHWVPYAAIVGLRGVSRSSLFQRGSLRTVLRGFTPDELADLALRAGLARVRVRRFWPFRLALVARPVGAPGQP
jgi:SAM-dependent methyltransferase